MAMSSGILGRNFYQQLSENKRKGGLPARIWFSLKRVAVRSIGFYVGKRRPLDRIVRKVVWISLHLKRRMARASKTRHVLTSYNAYSYSQNFDDGQWQNEEEEFYRSRSFSFRFVGLQSVRCLDF